MKTHTKVQLRLQHALNKKRSARLDEIAKSAQNQNARLQASKHHTRKSIKNETLTINRTSVELQLTDPRITKATSNRALSSLLPSSEQYSVETFLRRN